MPMEYVRKAAVYEDIQYDWDNRADGFPFKTFQRGGETKFKTSGSSRQETILFDDNDNDILNKKYLLLNDRDLWGDSGAVKLAVAPNWRVTLLVATDNNNYWKDNGSYPQYTFRPALLNRQDAMIVTLTGNDGDYISLDVDSDVSGIARYALRIGGVNYADSNPAKINDEVRVAILRAEHLEEVQDEVQGPLEEGGLGDIDNDGVIDGEDFDPYDPDIQEEGDIDDDPSFMDPEDYKREQDEIEEEKEQDDGDDEDDEPEEDRTFLWLIAVGFIVLIAIGVVALPRGRMEE